MSLPVVTIDTLAYGGNGVCRIDGKVCFVPYSCPGDEVSLQITSRKKSYTTAEISAIIHPSPSRATPQCAIFGVCGGCHWQHISYPDQFRHKRSILAEALWRGGRVPAELIDDGVSAASPFGYRNRIQFKVSAVNGKLRIGFYRKESHRVVEAVDGCPVAVPEINQVLSCCRTVLRSYPGMAAITQISVDAGDNGVVAVIHQSGKITREMKAFFARRGGEFGPCTGLYLASSQRQENERVWGDPVISYRMGQQDSGAGGTLLTYPPGGFAQVHQLQNRAMLSVIRRFGSFSAADRLLDLYCGNGNFSLPLAAEVASVTGIEGSAAAVRAAEYNRELNKVANSQYFCDDVALGVRRLADRGETFSTILLDPPRAGAGDAVSEIVRLEADKIIYVSCDPSTLARDCGLLAGYGYRVVAVVPVDMFPQTYHIESVTLLSR